jgi:hypothetical protein
MSKTRFSKEQALYVYKNLGEPKCRFFASVKEYIKQCLLSHDALTRIIIEDNAIYFGHSLQEINAAFPNFPRHTMNRLKSFSEDNVLAYGFIQREFDIQKSLTY